MLNARPLSLNVHAPTADVGFIGNLAPYSANRPFLNPLKYNEYVSAIYQPTNNSIQLNPTQFQPYYFGGFNWSNYGLPQQNPYQNALFAGASSFPAYPRMIFGGYGGF